MKQFAGETSKVHTVRHKSGMETGYTVGGDRSQTETGGSQLKHCLCVSLLRAHHIDVSSPIVVSETLLFPVPAAPVGQGRRLI